MFDTHHDIVDNRHIVSQGEVLVNHAQPGAQRRFWRARRQRRAIDFDTSFIGRVMAEEDVHQGGFARPVFAEQGQHLTALKIKVDVVVSHQGAEAFGDPA